MAVKSGYPETHYGSLEAVTGWEEFLPAGCYGDHAAWHAPAGELESNRGKAALIPWLLFNRNLWEEKAERLPAGAENLNLLIPRASLSRDRTEGWYVRLKLSEDLEIEGLEAVSTDDESAPAADGFEMLAPGPLPTSEAGSRRRRKRLMTGMLVLLVSAAVAGSSLFLSGNTTEEDFQASILAAELRTFSELEAALTTELRAKEALGLEPQRAMRILMDAIWFDAEVDLQEQHLLWLGTNSQPAGFVCDPPQTEGSRKGWSTCRWEVS